MSLNALIHKFLQGGTDETHNSRPYQPNTSKLLARLGDVFPRIYDLGLTAFGGPPVHFQILHRRFVDGMGKTPWIDEQTYQELFAICQAFSGPGSTKMLFGIVQIHAGIIPALFAFLVWSLPGAVGMYGLSLGVQRIDTILPDPVYALLSGLNAATVGIIALAAVQLARKAVTDKLARILVVFGGCAGLCYNALWYFPVLIVIGGLATLSWDCGGQVWLRRRKNRRNRTELPSLSIELETRTTEITTDNNVSSDLPGPVRRVNSARSLSRVSEDEIDAHPVQISQMDISAHSISLTGGLITVAAFLITFIILMSLRGALRNPSLLLSLFINMFLAGTVIFGGGPVVIPLLREYVVQPGWVSPRDFLLGLAIIQAFPGPNFNFSVYLGALAVATTKSPTIIGALLAYLGIFLPGLWITVGLQSVWRVLRKRREMISMLRGVNATAVGFVFTAVYRLWEIGFLTADNSSGISLGKEPWWLVVASTTFTVVEWFGVPPAAAILFGGVAGVSWWAAVKR